MEITRKNIAPYLIHLVRWFENQGIEVRPIPQVKLIHNESVSEDPLGATGYYDWNNQCIVLYVAGRHMKDVLRSFCHELIHHNQYLKYGDLDPGTANILNSTYLQKLEADAYFRGNMLFRSWENSFKNTL